MDALGFGALQPNREREELAKPRCSEATCFLWSEATNEDPLMAALLTGPCSPKRTGPCSVFRCVLFSVNYVSHVCIYLFRNYFTLEIESVLREKKKETHKGPTKLRSQSVSCRFGGMELDPGARIG